MARASSIPSPRPAAMPQGGLNNTLLTSWHHSETGCAVFVPCPVPGVWLHCFNHPSRQKWASVYEVPGTRLSLTKYTAQAPKKLNVLFICLCSWWNGNLMCSLSLSLSLSVSLSLCLSLFLSFLHSLPLFLAHKCSLLLQYTHTSIYSVPSYRAKSPLGLQFVSPVGLFPCHTRSHNRFTFRKHKR